MSNYITLTFPEQLLIPDPDIECTRGADGSTIVFDKVLTNGSVTQLVFTDYCETSDCAKDSEIYLRLSSLKNADGVKSFNSNITVETKEISEHPMGPIGVDSDAPIDSSAISYVSTLLAMELRNVQIHPINPTVSVTTDYLFIFTTTNHIPDGAYVVISFPSEYSLPTSTKVCNKYINNANTITCSSNANGNVRVNDFENSTDVGPIMVGFTVTDITNFTPAGVSGIFEIGIYNISDELVFMDDTQTVEIFEFISDDNCDLVCEKCAGDPDTCYECPFPAVSPLQEEYQCIVECPDSQFLKEPDRFCIPCHYTCANCYGP